MIVYQHVSLCLFSVKKGLIPAWALDFFSRN